MITTMKIESFVDGKELKRCIEDKVINTNSLKYILKCHGIAPLCCNVNDLAHLVYPLLLGSEILTVINKAINSEQNALKSALAILKDKKDTVGSLLELQEMLSAEERLGSDSKYKVSKVKMQEDVLTFNVNYTKKQRGRSAFVYNKEILLDVEVKKLKGKDYKLNIRHDTAAEPGIVVNLLEVILGKDDESAPFEVKRLTLDRLVDKNKISFFDKFGKYIFEDYYVSDIVKVSLNNKASNKDDGDEITTTNDTTGRLTGISKAILSGGSLITNSFVKECIEQGFYFSSMNYRLASKNNPKTIEVEIKFQRSDFKINLVKAWETDTQDKDNIVVLPRDEQEALIDYFQNVCYEIYMEIIKKQKENADFT